MYRVMPIYGRNWVMFDCHCRLGKWKFDFKGDVRFLSLLSTLLMYVPYVIEQNGNQLLVLFFVHFIVSCYLVLYVLSLLAKWREDRSLYPIVIRLDGHQTCR